MISGQSHIVFDNIVTGWGYSALSDTLTHYKEIISETKNSKLFAS